ncbi:hypothetical protein [Lujinxingia litoralis]|uniref:hypothetical protein n=1 Tax=Lujinxingia litoralis TaxID=2211119 RepID=UPI0011B947E0|nr:hypothetical protein [Lujinxingia litoralis]
MNSPNRRPGFIASLKALAHPSYGAARPMDDFASDNPRSSLPGHLGSASTSAHVIEAQRPVLRLPAHTTRRALIPPCTEDFLD